MNPNNLHLIALLNAPLGMLQLPSDPGAGQTSSMPGIDMTRYALVCLGLVAIILLLAWGFKRFLSGNMKLRANQRAMKVVDVLPLGGKRQLAVVRCYDRTFLIGMGEREVSLVTELDADEDVEGKLSQLPASEGQSFKGLFQRARQQEPIAEPSPVPAQVQPLEKDSLGPGVLG